METLVNELVEKAGISKNVAEKVGNVLQQNAAKLPQLLGGDTQGISQLLEKGGIDKNVVNRVVSFLQENAEHIPEWLGSQGGGILGKAKDMIGSVLGGGKESK